MADQNESFDSTIDSDDEDEVPEMRKKPDDPIDGLISTLKISKSIRVSFNQANLLERQVSLDIQQYITSLHDDPEIISFLGGHDFTDLIEEKRANDATSFTRQASSPNSGPPPPPPGPVAPPPPPGMKLQAMPSNRMVKLNWNPVRKGTKGNTVWETLPEAKIDREEIQKLFTVSKPVTTNKKGEEEKILTTVNVLDMRRSNNINIALKRYKHIANLKNLSFDYCGNTTVTKEEIEVIQKLYFSQPTINEEISQIEEAVETYPEIPLGTAEQFLLDVKSVPNLKIKLRFYIFKIDFPAAEEFISKSFRLLKNETGALKKNNQFLKLLSIVLETGRVFEKKEVNGFELDFLGQLDQIKDPISKQTLLFHVVKKISEKDPNFEVMSEETYQNLQSISKYDFTKNIAKDQEKFNIHSCLEEFEEESSMILENLSQDSNDQLENFVKDSMRRIVSLKKIHKLLLRDYATFLNWLAIPATNHMDFTPDKWACLMVKLVDDVRKTNRTLSSNPRKWKTSAAKGSFIHDLKRKVKK